MKFGGVDNPEEVDFTLPQDHPDTAAAIAKGKGGLKEVYVGCAKWNKGDLKKFYPRGTKDELAYYSNEFNSIELNATFYSRYKPEQIQDWIDKTADNFKFFPKVHRYISHLKRLNDFEEPVDNFLNMIHNFDKKLGMPFLQLHDNFSPKNMDRMIKFSEYWPVDLPLAVELRNTNWFTDDATANEIYQLFENYNFSNIITDTAGRRDLLHMRLTTPTAFVRYVGANHPSDYPRLDDWIDRIVEWKEKGLENLYFFVHQNLEKASPYLSYYFIEKLNAAIGTDLALPTLPESVDESLY